MLCFGFSVSSASTAPASNPVNDSIAKEKPTMTPPQPTPELLGQSEPRSSFLPGCTESAGEPLPIT
jgi:hypothetical protein